MSMGEPTDEYLCLLGRATFEFQRLEWQVRLLVGLGAVNQKKPGTTFPTGFTRHVAGEPDIDHSMLVDELSEVSRLTSGQLARELASQHKASPFGDHGLSADFSDLVQNWRNKIAHSNPARRMNSGVVLRRWHGNPFTGGEFDALGISWLAAYVDQIGQLDFRARAEVQKYR